MSGQLKEFFSRELAREDDQINLANANLLFSEYLTGPFDSAHYLSLLDELADSIWHSVSASTTASEAVGRLNQYLFEELKFSGNTNNYYEADNSFLNKVLDLRTGIPISLSLLYLELGWRLGLPVWGVGLPGHFIVGCDTPTTPIYIDVFNQGHLLSQDECLDLAQMPTTNRVEFRKQFLKPVSRKAILYRMLLNLKHLYVRAENWQAAYATVDLMLIVAPDQATDVRDRGLIAYRLNRRQEAIFDIQRYLFLAPHIQDASWLKKRLEQMEEELLRLN